MKDLSTIWIKLSPFEKERKFLNLLLLCTVALSSPTFADTVQKLEWQKGETLLTFFEKMGVPASLYYNLDREEKELADEIRAGAQYYLTLDSKGSLRHALIPINEELQIHIYKEGDYKLKLEPIAYDKFEDAFAISLDSSPYQDIIEATHNPKLAGEFVSAFRNSINFSRSIRKGDRLAIIYEQKVRMGEFFGDPKVKAMVIETRGRRHYVFFFDGRYYDQHGKELKQFFLKKPLSRIRITSRFTLRRWHPVLHRYRAHLGVDFGARYGTPVRAAGRGKVVFVGRKGGYGKVVMIYHGSGYKTLYAHLSRFKRGLRVGKRVRQGEVIGYVGSTGISTGPHLHFGLYKNNKAINPLRVVRIANSQLQGKKLREFKKLVKRYKAQIDKLLGEPKPPKRLEIVKEDIQYLGGDDGKG
ncbi:MAG: M23 family metallopeptidase [Epsilonproteobacteria bacterium]|nr:M23 family metallopeptidase [Campylobacterota bacterium]